MTGLRVYHTVCKLDKRQFNFVTNHVMAGKGMNDPHPGLEIVIHIQPGAGDLNLIESFCTGQRKTRQFFRGIGA